MIKPVEGTILTVAREAAEEAEAAYQDTQDIARNFRSGRHPRAKDALARTPDMLPILQKAGVVDSGGSGLVYIMEGMLRYLRGEDCRSDTTAPPNRSKTWPPRSRLKMNSVTATMCSLFCRAKIWT